MAWRRRVVLGVVAAAIGCGPAIDEPSATSDGSTSESTASSSESSSPATESSSSSSSDESSGSPLSCESFHDEAAEGTPLEIEIRNVGTQTLLLDSPCSASDFLDLSSASGGRWPVGFCTATCQTVFAEGCFVCDGCALASYTVLPPGTSHTVTWNGFLYGDVAPPQECFPFGSCNDTCPQKRLPTAEIVKATVRAITHADCVANEVDPTVCDCADPEVETCENYGSTYIEPSIIGEAAWEHGTAGPVVVIGLAG